MFSLRRKRGMTFWVDPDLPCQGNQQATIHRQDTFAKIPEPKEWGWSIPLDHRNWEGQHQKSKRGSYTLTTSPLSQLSTEPHQEGLPGLQIPWWVQEGRRQTPSSLPPPLGGTFQETPVGKSAGLGRQGSDRNGEGDGGLQRSALRSWPITFLLPAVPERSQWPPCVTGEYNGRFCLVQSHTGRKANWKP